VTWLIGVAGAAAFWSIPQAGIDDSNQNNADDELMGRRIPTQTIVGPYGHKLS
jgi:hypothetical protein